MKSLLRFILISTVMTAVSARAVQAPASARDTQPPSPGLPVFSLTLSAAHDSIKAGIPVWVTVTVTNITDHRISVWKENADDQGGFFYKVEVRNSHDASPADTKLGQRIRKNTEKIANISPDDLMTRSGGHLPIAAHEVREDSVNVSRLSDLTQPGRYSIQVRAFDDESKKFVKSNKVILTVTE